MGKNKRQRNYLRCRLRFSLDWGLGLSHGDIDLTDANIQLNHLVRRDWQGAFGGSLTSLPVTQCYVTLPC